jgi:hypothetical protein
MPGTLYKTKTPTTFDDGEYYRPDFQMEFIGGKRVYFVRETHGFWNNTEKRVEHVVTTLSPEDGFTSYEEAFSRYEQQVARRVKDGFVHSFAIDFYKRAGEGFIYEYLGK